MSKCFVSIAAALGTSLQYIEQRTHSHEVFSQRLVHDGSTELLAEALTAQNNCRRPASGIYTPWPLVRERTIPTERPSPVGEVSAIFCG